MFQRFPLALAVACGAAVLACTVAAATDTAQAETQSHTTVTSQSCVDQIVRLAAEKGVDPGEARSLCSATIVATQSEARVASVEEVALFAEQQNLSGADAAALMRAALDGSVSYRDWTHSYWGGSLLEKHAGRTFWDGSDAWIATYRGLTGANVCHSEGGIAVGWAVTPLECASPGPGAAADAYYRFDASVAFEGSPVTLDIGLHYSTTASGEVSTWQVGG